MTKVIFKAESFTFFAELNDSTAAREIIANLPLESTVSTWGDEIYFNIGFKASAVGALMEVNVGDVGYWPQGKCLCIFFGPTPDSSNENPLPASPVVIVGRTNASAEDLRKIKLGEKITVEKSGYVL